MNSKSSVWRFPCVPVVIAALSLLLAGCGVNNIPSYEESAKADWSQVLNQYQRRADLIPNPVETVKGYAAQERQVLEEVTNARARATQVQVQIPPDIVTNPEAFKRFQDAQAQLTGALGRLLAVSERYPDLKSNQNFLALQDQLLVPLDHVLDASVPVELPRPDLQRQPFELVQRLLERSARRVLEARPDADFRPMYPTAAVCGEHLEPCVASPS